MMDRRQRRGNFPPGVVLDHNIWIIICANFLFLLFFAVMGAYSKLVKCSGCGQFKTKSNLSRHQKICTRMTVAATNKVNGGSGRGTTPQRSRSASKNKEAHESPAPCVPTEVSPLLASVIREAVNALLDQHAIYTQQSLELYLARHYPELPDNLRAPVVIAATAGARQAALMHHVWEKNAGSPDEGKRRFAAGAASSLSFWALGMLPVHRSGGVYQPSAQTAAMESPVQVSVSASGGGPRGGRSRSPGLKQPRGRQDYFARRTQDSYAVNADEYRPFQDYVRQQRVSYHRK